MYNLKSLKTISAILIFVVLGMFIVYDFMYQSIKSKNEHISALLQDLSRENQSQDYLISTQRAIQDINPDITRIKSSIISRDGDVKFIDDLESTARGDGLTIEISSLVFDDNSKLASSSAAVLKIKAKTQGSWLGTYTFLSQLESLPFKIKVNRFDFSNTTVANNAGTRKVGTVGNDWQSTFEIYVLKYK